MFSSLYSFSGQGPVNSHASIANFSNSNKQFKTPSNVSKARKSRIGQALFLLFGLIIFSSNVFGQESGNLPLGSLPHSLTLTSQTSTSLDYELTVGTSADPVNNAFGFYLSGTLTDLDGAPSTMEVSLENSWMGNATDGDLTIVYDYTTGEYEITFIRDDSTTVSDHGLMIEISVVAEPNETIPDDARLTTGGVSLVMVDNSGFKRSSTPEITYQRLTAYPNPTQGQVRFQTPGFEGEWSLSNTAGRMIMNGKGALPETIDLSGYPKGMYFLIAQSGDQYYRSTLVRN